MSTGCCYQRHNLHGFCQVSGYHDSVMVSLHVCFEGTDVVSAGGH